MFAVERLGMITILHGNELLRFLFLASCDQLVVTKDTGTARLSQGVNVCPAEPLPARVLVRVKHIGDTQAVCTVSGAPEAALMQHLQMSGCCWKFTGVERARAGEESATARSAE